jgi:hypothetical protein
LIRSATSKLCAAADSDSGNRTSNVKHERTDEPGAMAGWEELYSDFSTQLAKAGLLLILAA